MVTKCTIGTHATFIPPEDHWDESRAVLESQADVLRWTIRKLRLYIYVG